jgi:hypothetical protein
MDDSTNFSKFFTNTQVLEGLEGKYSPPVNEHKVDDNKQEHSAYSEDALPKVISGADFPPPWELETRPYLIDGMLQRGDTALVSAPPKLGKSFFWGNVAISLGTGTPFLGRETSKSNVLIIDLELRKDVAIDRLIGIAQGRGFEKVPENVYLWSLARHTYDLDAICEALKDELENLPKMDLVVVDPIYVLDRGDNFDENSAHSVTRLLTALEKLTTEQDSALGLCHHTRKGNLNKTDSLDRSSGSSAFSRFCSVNLSLSHHEHANCVIVQSTTRNFKSPEPLCFELDHPIIKERKDLDPSKFRPYGEAGISAESSNRKILHALPQHPISKQEWFSRCRSFGVSEDSFITAVKDLSEEGLVIIEDSHCRRKREEAG